MLELELISSQFIKLSIHLFEIHVVFALRASASIVADRLTSIFSDALAAEYGVAFGAFHW